MTCHSGQSPACCNRENRKSNSMDAMHFDLLSPQMLRLTRTPLETKFFFTFCYTKHEDAVVFCFQTTICCMRRPWMPMDDANVVHIRGRCVHNTPTSCIQMICAFSFVMSYLFHLLGDSEVALKHLLYRTQCCCPKTDFLISSLPADLSAFAFFKEIYVAVGGGPGKAPPRLTSN